MTCCKKRSTETNFRERAYPESESGVVSGSKLKVKLRLGLRAGSINVKDAKDVILYPHQQNCRLILPARYLTERVKQPLPDQLMWMTNVIVDKYSRYWITLVAIKYECTIRVIDRKFRIYAIGLGWAEGVARGRGHHVPSGFDNAIYVWDAI
ncbi:hypothetical protein EVAR_92451_1 [Eumeta japonica]|uniref:Uncharacterized protein n=1 Tax=Eumeta variegata TaxID=151549 RepID=A0A4C1T6U5_EUMVA|nr:hypothetical protein EVAR_92451_1 [Eumeta japonica]